MSELRKAESELDEGLRLGALLWPQKMAAELRRLHEIEKLFLAYKLEQEAAKEQT